jgi:RimJ/RimL family protein N-acetyltransferase
LTLWIIAIAAASWSPLVVAGFSHAYIWVHYFCTEQPDMQVIADWFLDFDSQATEEQGHPIHFAIREPSGNLIGVCGFEGLTYGHRAEIGYWLVKPYWRRGVMTDVVGAACEFAFGSGLAKLHGNPSQ